MKLKCERSKKAKQKLVLVSSSVNDNGRNKGGNSFMGNWKIGRPPYPCHCLSTAFGSPLSPGVNVHQLSLINGIL